MIYFETPGRTYSGHVGSNILLNFEDVSMVQADGDELTKCERIIGRSVDTRVAKFVGAEARLIAAVW